MDKLPDALLLKHHVLVASENPFQQRARLLQALWRERGWPIGERAAGAPLGSRLPMDFAKESRVNLMTAQARAAAERELGSKLGQKIDEGRLWANLLSSQPLAFSLFADLAEDLDCATRVLRRLWPERVRAVTKIGFEFSPGRSSATYTADKTAFDVYFEHSTEAGGRGFIGLEVKYHENLNVKPARHRARYDEVTELMACFRPELVTGLRVKPIEQVWRDHMLAGSMLLDAAAKWEMGLYVFLYPEDNAACHAAAEAYPAYLTNTASFDAVTLEAVVAAIEAETSAPWIRELRSRYLGWAKIDQLLARS